MTKRHLSKFIIVALVITLAVFLEYTGLLDADRMLDVARGYTDHWWLVLVLILLQVVLFTFALAGSFFVWIVAPLFPPPMATLILAAGGTLGGITAYLFSKHLTDEWIDKIESSRTYRVLQNQGNFFVLFAMRVFPGFPHALVNYSSGILNVKLSHFIAAAISGLALKFYIYANLIYTASAALSTDESLDFSALWPLVLLSVIILLGILVKYWLTQRHRQSK